MIKNVLMNKNGSIFYVKDITKDYHCQFGFFKKQDLKKKNGSLIKTNKGYEFTLVKASFIDSYKKIKRDAQIISPKDIGVILSYTGINKNSVVVDAGAGSGALCCMLAHVAKKVITYDIREDFIKVVEENKKSLNLKNLIIKHKNLYEGIDEKDVDLIVLDLPEPWNTLEPAAALKPGGFLVSYSPSIPQTIDFVNAINCHKNFCHLKTIELIEREWEIQERRVRPKTQMIGHTGFLSFCRRI